MLRGIIVVLCMVVSLTFAQQDQTKTQTAPPPAAPALAPAAPAKGKPVVVAQGPTKVLAGSIASIDQEKKVLSIKVNSGTYPVSLDEKTVVLAGNQPAAFADLKKGEKVHIEYQKASNGQRIAVRVNAPALKPAAPKAAAAPKKEAAAPKAEPATPAKSEVKAAAAPAAKTDSTIAKPAARATAAPAVKADTSAAAKPAAKPADPAPAKK